MFVLNVELNSRDEVILYIFYGIRNCNKNKVVFLGETTFNFIVTFIPFVFNSSFAFKKLYYSIMVCTLKFYKKLYILIYKIEIKLQRTLIFTLWKLLFLLIGYTQCVKRLCDFLFSLRDITDWTTTAKKMRRGFLIKFSMFMANDNYFFVACFVFCFTIVVSVAVKLFGFLYKLFSCQSSALSSFWNFFSSLREHCQVFLCEIMRTGIGATRTSMFFEMVAGSLSKMFSATFTDNRYSAVSVDINRFGIIVVISMYLSCIIYELFCIKCSSHSCHDASILERPYRQSGWYLGNAGRQGRILNIKPEKPLLPRQKHYTILCLL